MIFLQFVNIMVGEMVGIILQFVKILMENGILTMIQFVHLLQKIEFVQEMPIFYFIEEGIGKKILILNKKYILNYKKC